MCKLPTDLKILEHIYAAYADAFRNFVREEPNRSAKIYVPIDVRQIADRLRTDPYILFGRLYHHLNHKYRYKEDDGSEVHLFAFQVGGDRHCINYPYLAGILAEHRAERRRNLWALGISIVAVVVASASMVAQIITAK